MEPLQRTHGAHGSQHRALNILVIQLKLSLIIRLLTQTHHSNL